MVLISVRSLRCSFPTNVLKPKFAAQMNERLLSGGLATAANGRFWGA